MGYFNKLSLVAGPGEQQPAPMPAVCEANPAAEQTAAQTAAQPAAKPAANQPVSAAIAASHAADPAASQPPMMEDVPSPTAVRLDSGPKDDDTAARQAHEAGEAKRKADWDAKQREKAAAEQARLSRLAAMSDEDAIAASTQRVSADTERLTRRNMKDCVAAHIQELCRQDPAFARRTLHPRKSMLHCFQYIYRKAKGYIQTEMKANGIQDEMKANSVQPESGVYGDDVPDDLVYQWAVDYFNDPNAQEDEEKDDKFIPKPYVGKTSKTSKTAKAAPKTKKEPAAKATPKPKPQLNASVDGQLSFLGVAG